MSSCDLIFKLEQETDKLKTVIFWLYFRAEILPFSTCLFLVPTWISSHKMTIFGLCFILYFFKLSSGCGFCLHFPPGKSIVKIVMGFVIKCFHIILIFKQVLFYDVSIWYLLFWYPGIGGTSFKKLGGIFLVGTLCELHKHIKKDKKTDE